MSIKLTFTTAAVVAILAGPAFAGDHDLATELRDSGRYVPQANLPEAAAPGVGLPSGAFASAARPVRVRAPRAFASAARPVRVRAPRAFASAARPVRVQAPSAFVTTPAPAHDFQLQGR
jgi:hypothetical protein